MARQPGVYATLDTSEGTIVCRLFEQDAPITVKNFIELAEGTREWTDPRTRQKSKSPLYDGTIFHRVIPDFMIQGGDPTGTGMGGPGYQFQDETKDSPHKFDKPGKLAMANSGPGTNGSQFFVTVAATPWLTGNHTIFGEVVEGQDIANKITAVPRRPSGQAEQGRRAEIGENRARVRGPAIKPKGRECGLFHCSSCRLTQSCSQPCDHTRHGRDYATSC